MKFFIKCSIRNFTSSTKERFKKIIEYSEPHSLFKKKDDTLFQMLCFSLEKQNLTKFNEIMDLYEIYNNSLELEQINKVFSYLSYKKVNYEALERLTNYTLDRNINLNCLSYSYLINAYLRHKGFLHAYYFFFQAKLNRVKLDLSVYYSLFNKLENLRNNHVLYKNSKLFLKMNLNQDFDVETIKNFDKSKKSLIFSKNSSKYYSKQTDYESLKHGSDEKSSLIFIDSTKGTPLYMETKIISDKTSNLIPERSKYKDFHKISKNFLKKINNRNNKIDFQSKKSVEKRNKLIMQCDKLIQELNLDRNALLDLSKINEKDMQKIQLLLHIIEKLKSPNELENDPIIDLNNNLISGFILFNQLEKIKKRNENGNSGINN